MRYVAKVRGGGHWRSLAWSSERRVANLAAEVGVAKMSRLARLTAAVVAGKARTTLQYDLLR
jgi:hypothetical protein